MREKVEFVVGLAIISIMFGLFFILNTNYENLTGNSIDVNYEGDLKKNPDCTQREEIIIYTARDCSLCKEQMEIASQEGIRFIEVKCNLDESECSEEGISIFPSIKLGKLINPGLLSSKELKEFACSIS